MAVEFGEVYSFDEFELAPDTRRLSRGNQPVHLTKKPFNVLTYLIQNRERMVTRRELLDTFWDGHDVYEETLTKCVGAIRKALGDNPENPRLIETFWAEGYRFIGDVNDQYVPAQSVSVVERTRAVTITVEDDVAPDNRLLTLPLKPAAAKYVAAAGLFILVCALTGVLLYRSSNAARGTHHLTRSLAVLPLKNLTGDPGDDYLCDGVTESLINSLSKLQNLKVIARGSSFMFKDREIEPVDAGKAFGVEAVLIGSVQKEDGVFKVTARLVDTVDGRVLWATEIKRPANDIFGLQAEIAREVAVNLQPQSDEAPKIASRPTDNIEAYQDYLRGRFSWNKRTPDSLQKAIGHFERAIQKDQNYTLAYTGLADCYILLAEYNVTTPHDSIPKAAAAVGRALELDAQSAEAYAALGYTQTVYDWNWEAADASFRRALELDPNYATAHQWYGEYLMGVGRFDESRAHLERAIEIEPVSPIILSGLANFHHLRGDYDNEINSSLKVIEIDPSFAYATFYLGLGYEGRGMDAEAADALTRTVMQFGEPLECVHELSEASKKNGIRGWWQQRLKQVETRPHLKNFQAYFKALILIRLDDKEGTLNALNQAYDRRDRGLAFAKYEPRLDPLRGDPRFEDLLRRMGL